MKKVIKLTASMDGEIVYFNPYRFTFIVEAKPGRYVHFGKPRIEVEESLEEIKKFIDDPEFIEFIKIKGSEGSLLINANQISEWHEQDGGVFIQVFDSVGFIVEGTLEEVTAKIEKALEGVV